MGTGRAMKFDSEKPKLTLVDPRFVEDMARVLWAGECKYGERNWQHGLDTARIIDAARRHLAALERGEDLDEESGMPHAVHAACNLMFFEWYRKETDGQFDNRRYKDQVQKVRRDAGPKQVRTFEIGEVRLHLQPVQKSGQERTTESEPEGSQITALQERISRWADSVFPDRTPNDALRKLMMEEIPELLHGGLDDPLEWADILILVLDIATLRGINPVESAHRKMDINEQRRWKYDEASGLMHHVESREAE